ncbi:MAG: glycoside hydrolase family 97 N-terminal domain-containing protein, partial [Planctomycetota bacterium]
MTKRQLNRIIAANVGLFIIMMSVSTVSIAADEINLVSPNGRIRAFVSTDTQGQLTYRVTHKGKAVIETSALGITVDGQNLGLKVKIGIPARQEILVRYPWRGGKNRAVNHC